MSEREAFIRNIIDQPDDDTVRLVFADWLEEHGEAERAGYIRHMIAQDTHKYAGWDCDMNSGEPPWPHRPTLTEITGLPNSNGDLPRCRRWYWRGFVEQVEMTAAHWLQFADAILAAHPVREVRLTTTPDIPFGPIEEYERPARDFDGFEIACKWTATTEGGSRRFGLSALVTKEDVFTGAAAVIREQLRRRVERARTPLGYLESRWPDVAFEPPPSGAAIDSLFPASVPSGPASPIPGGSIPPTG